MPRTTTPQAQGPHTHHGSLPRDVRLDFFRGLAMFIIFMAHMPRNPWNDWIPARFGPSDATEIFVFCSGFASSIAFGGTFARHGFAIGTFRILHRCWQVFWSHIGLFWVVLAITIVATAATGIDYLHEMNLRHFLAEPERGVVGLLTLTYVPNYFDILPMYLVALALVPLMVGLARISPWLAMAASGLIYLAEWTVGLDLPAEWWSDRSWFFDPFGWQFLFFTGFAFGSGWLPEPLRDRRLLWACVAFVLVMVPLNWAPIWSRYDWLDWFSLQFVPWKDKSHFGILRWVHFLALAYVALWIVNGRPDLLRSPAVRPIVRVGQQALAVFLWSMAFAWTMGILLDQIGRNALTITAANLIGFASLVGVAYLAGFVKEQPWRRREGRVRLHLGHEHAGALAVPGE
ncbi:MAG: OpgC domain-containing protein [Geminicoccaceae bacterium]